MARKRTTERKQAPARSRRTWYIVLTAAVIVHGAFLLSLRFGFLDPLFNDSTHRLPRGVDFYAVYQKAHEYSIGKSLYTDVDYRDRVHFVVPYCAPHYRYLPSWGWFMSITFCRMEARSAYWLWVVLCEAMLLVCLWMFLRRTDDPVRRAGFVAIWLCYSPFYLELFVGQFTFMATALITLSLLAFEDKREWRGAVWLTLSIALKYVGVFLLAPLFLLGKWRQVLAIVGAVAVILLLYFVPNPGDWSYFTGVATYGTPNQFHAGNLGLQGLLGNVFKALPYDLREAAAGTAIRFFLLRVIPGLVVLFLLWVTWRYRSEKNFIPLCLLWLTAYFLIGTDVFEHHHVILLPVFAFAWLKRPSRWLWVFYVWIALPTIFVFVDIHELPHQVFVEVENIWWKNEQYARIFLYHLWKIVATAGLFVWLFGLIDRSPARAAS